MKVGPVLFAREQWLDIGPINFFSLHIWIGVPAADTAQARRVVAQELLIAINQDTLPRLIVNRISAHLVKRGDMLSQADVIEILALEMLGAIPLDDQVIATTNKGVPAVLENKCLAAKEFIRIAKKLAGHEVEDEAVGFFTRIGRALGLSATPA